ncbi:serine/threonine-protein phosphatase [Nocardioides sp. MAH-18]|uniref:Serine/threonine-protein phosphatase n=1 Tax=Nocardioides agri TaxID=2682843 RepID=A0A6L6XT22_9ACTN|nr:MULTISPECIES: protein phosphatase 2C domain-containing protein [unclassified Nocardioides]MBA2955099.1 serine/threonine-protein phosphatase [Nocardioides sp. CGMCC 1.13656]MVQ49952.1 serine/threonine-protein phosphatase [Nocardioides sp. MAH-18]
MTEQPPEQPASEPVRGPRLRLDYSAVSDVGRVRRDNQDSGYAGPWLLAVCDGVGGAAGGDIASSTAIAQLRRLDEPPSADASAEDLLGRIAGAVHRAHDRLVEVVDENPALHGTSTTATLLAFDGTQVGVGHAGDSRAYLFRDGTIRQITTDHTFVQTLIDDGRITEDEARVHPHRNLILRAIDASSDTEPDLFVLDVHPGDRLLVCSDGASGVLDNGRLADILATGNAEYAAVELVRASLEAGSTDNVTCVVGDVLDASDAPADAVGEPEVLVVGAAAERRAHKPARTGLFRGHRSGDTGELDPVPADLPPEAPADAIDADPESARYAPRPPRRFVWAKRLCALAIVIGLAWVAAAALWSWTQKQYYVGEQDGAVVIFRGLNASLPGLDLSEPYQTTDLQIADLSEFDASKVEEGIDADDLADAQQTVENLASQQPDDSQPDPATES